MWKTMGRGWWRPLLARCEKVSAMRHWRAWAVAVLLLAPLLAAPARVQAEALAATPGEWVETYCTIAKWRADRILASYGISEQTYQAVQAQARQVTVPVVLKFPDISPYRARIRALANSVCTAPDVEAAKKALDALEVGRQEISKQWQAWTGVSDGMKKAWATLNERTTEQMKPFVAEAKARNKQAIANERARVVKTDDRVKALAKPIGELSKLVKDIEYRRAICAKEPASPVPSVCKSVTSVDHPKYPLMPYENLLFRELTEAQDKLREAQAQFVSYMQQRLQPFIQQLKGRTEAQLQAKVAELRKPDEDRLKAIGTLFKEMRQKQDAFAAAGKGEWPQVWKQVVQKRTELYLKDVDAKIAQAKQKIEEAARTLTPQQREDRGFAALLAAIEQARRDLEPALEGALTKKDSKAVKEALDIFHRRWAEARIRQTCTSAKPKLLASREWATKTLEKLGARTPQNPQVQAAVAAIQTWVQDIQRAEQLCSVQPIPSVQQVREAMAKTVQDAAEVKKAMEALKAGAKP